MHQDVSEKTSNGSLDPFDQSMQYWQVGNQKTFNKMQAILWAKGDFDKIQYNVMNNSWDHINWSQRPTHSVADLMNLRCHQLRDQYKEVWVGYSGGYDSQGIINSFLSAGIPIDGIFVRLREFNPLKENLLAIQQANSLKDTVWPLLKIDLRHITTQDFKDYYKKNKEDWINDTNEPWFTKTSLKFYEDNIKSYQHVTEKFLSKSSCDVYGYEKPRLWIEDGNWYSTMIDSAFMWAAGSNVENFYISADLPELHHAQTWAMLDWIESQPFNEVEQVHTFLHAVQSHSLGWDINRDWNIAIGRSHVLNAESYQCGGTKILLRGDIKNTQLCQNLKKVLSTTDKNIIKIWSGQLDDLLNYYGKDKILTESNQLKNCWSKKYYIKPVEPGINFKKSIR
jgi:hypothetical protein